MKLSDNAQKVWDHLPEDGTKIGGITLQRDLQLSKLDYTRVRDELKEHNLVESGAGRGGSLGRREGAKVEKGPTRVERMAHAREAKVAKSRERKELDALVEKVVKYCHDEGFPQVEHKDVTFSNGRPIIAIWEGPSARMHAIPQLEWDKLNAVRHGDASFS